MIVALEVPLAINLQRRAKAELETQALVRGQEIAASVGAEGIKDRAFLGRLQTSLHKQTSEDQRVIVINGDGKLVVDSSGPGLLGRQYATSERPELKIALRGDTYTQTRYSTSLKQDILVAAVPILDESLVVGAVRVSLPTAEISANLRHIIYGLVAIGLTGLGAGLLIAFGLAGSFSRPLSKLAGAAHGLGSGDLSARAGKTGGASEIQELAGSFDEMADRLEASVRAQREFVANASHQLRTPLTGMKLRLESAIADAPSGEVRHQLEAADKEVDRLAEIVEQLLVTSRRIETGGPAEVDVKDAVDRAVGRWAERATRLGATLVAKGSDGKALGDRTDLDQILDNLVDNAISYAPGPVVVESGRGNGRVFVAVEDRGPGIPAHDVGRVTERFFRGRSAPPGGSGLGLAIVRELAEKWGGKVVIAAPEAGGTRVEIRMTAAEAPPDDLP